MISEPGTKIFMLYYNLRRGSLFFPIFSTHIYSSALLRFISICWIQDISFMLSYLSSLIRWLHGFFRIGANFIAQSMMKDVLQNISLLDVKQFSARNRTLYHFRWGRMSLLWHKVFSGRNAIHCLEVANFETVAKLCGKSPSFLNIAQNMHPLACKFNMAAFKAH